MQALDDSASVVARYDLAMKQPTAASPLSYPGYAEQLLRAAQQSGVDESVNWVTSTVGGVPCVTARFAFEFMGGSLGEESGRRLVEAIDHAASHRLPLVSYLSTGGARIQEGVRALMQMQRVAHALERLRRQAVPHICVAGEPTTGGVWASLGARADVIVAARGATVAFAGLRVRDERHARHDPDARAFQAEGKLEGGFVDEVVAPERIDEAVARYVRVLGAGPAVSLEACPPPAALGSRSARTGWEAVLNARASQRPRAKAYLDAYFETRVAIAGDRAGGHDPAMLCGVGLHRGERVAFAAQTGSPNRAAGFRTVTRLLALAGDLRIPVLTLVDTPGAANDAQAEREGIGTAIADTFAALARTTSPVTTLVIGEGGSGGALALCAPANTWITPDAYFSVISPEGAAAILCRDRGQAPRVADRLRITPEDTVNLGLAAGIVSR